MSRHHRKPSSRGGTESQENISFVPYNGHRAWHGFAKNLSPNEICELINEKYLDPEYMFICVRREEMINGETQVSMKCWACRQTFILEWDAERKCYRCPQCLRELIPMHDQLELPIRRG